MGLLDDIRRDRETGTPGPWEKRSFQSGTVQVVLREWNNSKPDPTRDGSMYGYHSAYMTMHNIGWQDESDTDREKSANASRIARVPEMEDRILADAEALKAADDLANSVDTDWHGNIDLDFDEIKDALAAYTKAREGQ